MIWELSGGEWVDRQWVWWVDQQWVWWVWFGNSVVMDGLIGGGFDGLIGTRWWWMGWSAMDLIGWSAVGLMGRSIWWVWFGFGFIWVWWVDRFWFFHMGFIDLISYWWLLSWFWFHCFDLLFWWVYWVSRTWIVMFFQKGYFQNSFGFTVLLGLLGFKLLGLLGRTWRTRRTSSSKKKIMERKWTIHACQYTDWRIIETVH